MFSGKVKFLEEVAQASQADAWLSVEGNKNKLTWDGRHYFYSNRLYVPKGMGLREALCKEAHDSQGHLGFQKCYP